VPGEFVRGVEQRRASRGKTFLLAGASMLGFVVAYQAFGPGLSGAAVGGSVPGGTHIDMKHLANEGVSTAMRVTCCSSPPA